MNLLSQIFGSSGLKLTQQLGAYPLPNGEPGPLHVLFGVGNTGRDAIEVSSVRVVPKGEDEPLPVEVEGEVPTKLAAGETARYEVRAKTLARAASAAGRNGVAKLTFVVTDGEGNETRRDFTLRVDEYLALRDD